MEILVKRIARKDTYTIGKLYIDGVYFCDTIEDKDRGLKKSMTAAEVAKVKVYGKTAIPTGVYRVTLNVVSNKFRNSAFYKTYCNGGRVPRLLNVPGFEGILIHAGNTAADSYGCILLGQNKVVGKVINSRDTCAKFYKKVFATTTPITITIK